MILLLLVFLETVKYVYFNRLIKAQKQLFKKLLVSSILATDMAKHAKLLDKFTKRLNITLKAKADPKFLVEQPLLEEFIYSDKKIDDRRVILSNPSHIY